jgi:hypothetical protein
MMQRAIAVAIVVLAAASCDEAPNNTELCRKVYTALCARNEECGTYTYYDECVSLYREECRVMRLHDRVTEPTEEETAACVEAIGELDCDGTLDPSEASECRFLREVPDGEGDGGADADADGDGDTDADADTDS